jgi:biopolymer transport protein ExbD
MAGAVVGGDGKRKVDIHIDMTPMVDVIILLLIFFFMTSQFKEPSAIEITLPRAGDPDSGPDIAKIAESNVLTVIVDDEEKVLVKDSYYREGKEVTLEELGDYIEQRQANNENLVTIIDVSHKARYSKMVDVLDEFKVASEKTGVKKISLQLEELPTLEELEKTAGPE